MMKNLYAMTNPGSDNPGFISVNQTEHGRITVAVRTEGKQESSEIGLTKQQARQLVQSLAAAVED